MSGYILCEYAAHLFMYFFYSMFGEVIGFFKPFLLSSIFLYNNVNFVFLVCLVSVRQFAKKQVKRVDNLCVILF